MASTNQLNNTVNTYYLYRKQAGEGCDYTIQCGVDFEEIKGAKTMEDAIQKVVHANESEDVWEHQIDTDPHGEQTIEEAWVVECSSVHKFNLKEWERKRAAKQKESEEAEKEEEERETYKKLKQKYDK